MFLVVWRKLEGACESNIDVKVLLVNTHVRCIHKSSFKNKKTSNFSFGLDVCCLCNWFWFFKKLGDLLFWKWLRSLWLFLNMATVKVISWGIMGLYISYSYMGYLWRYEKKPRNNSIPRTWVCQGQSLGCEDNEFQNNLACTL